MQERISGKIVYIVKKRGKRRFTEAETIVIMRIESDFWYKTENYLRWRENIEDLLEVMGNEI